MFLEKNRDRIEKDFEDFSRELPGKAEEIKKRMEALSPDIVIGMKYLYSNMPYSDVGNYTFDTYLDYVQQGIYLWENSPYVKNYPELYFLNYVLFHRTNDEEIKPCRTYFWKKIKDKVQGKTMVEAALEINHWCAGEVMYQGTDMRTGSALEIYRSGVGRCGEEAVFVVNVMRSAGIPARPVYVPRWSHCDDNHAWVEVWCDGDWHYLGACEPEAVLDKSWFTNAASRAMMIGSRWYDRAMPDEKVIGKDGMNRIINLLGKYAKTRWITITVEDLDGTPAAGAKVRAEVMNYGEFSPIAIMEADKNGCISFETGFGSLLICAVYDGAYGEKVIDTREDDHFTCTLGEEYEDELWVDFDMNAPEDTGRISWNITQEQEEENNRRIAAEAEHCRRKIEKFQPLWKRCLFGHTMKEVEPMMAVLSEKDRRDAFPEVLEGHYQEASVYREFNPDEIYIPYVWNPRVENEVLTRWRKKILGYFDKGQRDAFEADPKSIWTWIEENISVRNDKERLTAYTTPGAALELGIAGEKSHKVLFVAIARTLGIPARLNPADGAIEYWDGMRFVAVLEESRKESHLTVFAGEKGDWNYFQNWTIAVTDGRGYLTLDFSDRKWEAGKLELDIMPGDYRILTGNRLPNGNILGKRYDFHIEKDETKRVELTEQIGLAQTELTYIDSVFESLALAENERDLNEIRAELAEQGYVRRRAGKKNQKQPALSAPLKFKTSDGFTVLVGRNNRQNDKLTMKDANNNDIWFHTKNIPGSHTVLVTDGKAPTETAMEEAAVLAAQHSRAKDSAQVPVDYTQIRYVSKPQGAKPGMVIYVQYKTVYVDPTIESKAKQQS